MRGRLEAVFRGRCSRNAKAEFFNVSLHLSYGNVQCIFNISHKKLRRNDSYVSSMGRTREELLAASAARKRQVQATAPHLEVQDEILDVDDQGAQQHTDSVLVTLV